MKPTQMQRLRIGLALGSGSARGWSHIGIIESLAEEGIEADIVCGTSMGALVGAAYVAGQLTPLRKWAEAVSWREIVGLMDLRLLRGGLINGKQIVGFLRSLEVAGPIGDFDKAYAAIATDLTTGSEVQLTTGHVEDAVRASIALPGIFSPKKIDDRWLVDGGLVNPVPVTACRALGADIVIAVNLNGDRVGRRLNRALAAKPQPETRNGSGDFLERIQNQMPMAIRRHATLLAPRLLQLGFAGPGYFDVIANSINIMQAQITTSRLAAERPDIVLTPNLRYVGLLEFNRAPEAIAAGRACVADALPDIRAQIEARERVASRQRDLQGEAR
jgi:NTE family protein